MLVCLSKKKTHLQKDYCEDTKTSSIIGTLKNLPADLFWEILRDACYDNSSLPQLSGEIIDYLFWPGWTYKTRVEPDVFIRFSEFDLIIEAKVQDNGGQYKEQWEREIAAYYNEFYNENENTPRNLIFIALGGSHDMTVATIDQTIEIAFPNAPVNMITTKTSVYKCNWYTLLLKVSYLKENMQKINYWAPNRNANIRILEDTILGFNLHGLYNIQWLDSLNPIDIKEHSINFFRTHNTTYGNK